MISCSGDTLTPREHCLQIARLAGARFREITARGGHMWMVVDPAKFAQVVSAAAYTETVKQIAALRVTQAAAKYGEHAPLATACCNACRTCVTTNVVGIVIGAIAGAGLGVARLGRRLSRREMIDR